MIRHLIFDLDDTLLDTTQFLRPIAETPAFVERIRKPLPLMPGAKENLDKLKGKYRLFLLTLGHVEYQQQKIRSLGIENTFEKFVYVDTRNDSSKIRGFERLQREVNEPPETFLSIGNRRWMDIREAKKCGMKTCHFKHGEHQEETVECPEDIPDFEISSHQELIPKCHL